jgi:hypothetical protein
MCGDSVKWTLWPNTCKFRSLYFIVRIVILKKINELLHSLPFTKKLHTEARTLLWHDFHRQKERPATAEFNLRYEVKVQIK